MTPFKYVICNSCAGGAAMTPRWGDTVQADAGQAISCATTDPSQYVNVPVFWRILGSIHSRQGLDQAFCAKLPQRSSSILGGIGIVAALWPATKSVTTRVKTPGAPVHVGSLYHRVATGADGYPAGLLRLVLHRRRVADGSGAPRLGLVLVLADLHQALKAYCL
jgi:hypothetical protein